jgi:hypothetical protein
MRGKKTVSTEPRPMGCLRMRYGQKTSERRCAPGIYAGIKQVKTSLMVSTGVGN